MYIFYFYSQKTYFIFFFIYLFINKKRHNFTTVQYKEVFKKLLLNIG